MRRIAVHERRTGTGSSSASRRCAELFVVGASVGIFYCANFMVTRVYRHRRSTVVGVGLPQFRVMPVSEECSSWSIQGSERSAPRSVLRCNSPAQTRRLYHSVYQAPSRVSTRSAMVAMPIALPTWLMATDHAFRRPLSSDYVADELTVDLQEIDRQVLEISK